MKKIIVIFAAVFMIIGLTAQSVFSVDSQKGTISVSISAETEMAPDVAEVAFTVVTKDSKSMQKATSNNKEISDKVYEKLKTFINTNAGDYIKTADFNCTPIYTYSNSKQNFDHYEVTNRIIIHTKSLDNLGKIIDNAINSGATNVDSLNFSISSYETQCNELLASASNKALQRAKTVAKSISATVDGVNTFNTSCGSESRNSGRFYMAKNVMLSTAEGAVADENYSATTISNGVIKIRANVNASFYVK